MATYIFRCDNVGGPHRFEAATRDVDRCPGHMTPVMRDYRAEGVGIGTGVRASRDGTLREQAGLFLPNNDDFAGPGDPDGTKGMRAWRDTHVPKDTNAKPLWPGDVERTTF